MRRRPLAWAWVRLLALLALPALLAAAAAECPPAALRCAARAPLALVARLRSATADRRVCTFQVRQLLHGSGARTNDTLRLAVRWRGLRVDAVYLLLAERRGAALRLLQPPLLQRCLPRGFRAQLRRARARVSKHHCKANEEFRECGTKCPATCDTRVCTKTCVPGCFCKPGFVKDQGECVHINKARQNFRGNPRLEIRPKDDRIIQGGRIQLFCKVQGYVQTHSLFWYKDGRRLYAKTNSRITVNNKKRSSVLVIANTTVNDSGLYECRDSQHRSLTSNVTVAYETVTIEQSCPMEDPNLYCMNGGTCIYYYALAVPACRCKDDYQGERCENKVVSNHSSRYSYTCKLGLSTSYYC